VTKDREVYKIKSMMTKNQESGKDSNIQMADKDIQMIKTIQLAKESKDTIQIEIVYKNVKACVLPEGAKL
jgi:hypothetical protein